MCQCLHLNKNMAVAQAVCVFVLPHHSTDDFVAVMELLLCQEALALAKLVPPRIWHTVVGYCHIVVTVVSKQAQLLWKRNWRWSWFNMDGSINLDPWALLASNFKFLFMFHLKKKNKKKWDLFRTQPPFLSDYDAFLHGNCLNSSFTNEPLFGEFCRTATFHELSVWCGIELNPLCLFKNTR